MMFSDLSKESLLLLYYSQNISLLVYYSIHKITNSNANIAAHIEPTKIHSVCHIIAYKNTAIISQCI